jgi:DNA-binding transcriptional LysR family regulator
MELRQLRYFVAVAEAGSFSAAATVLHMSQPPLSLAIAHLERELGVTLFVRTSKGVRITGAGSQLLESAHQILDDVSALTDRLARYSTGHTGRITLAAVPSLMWNRIPSMLRRYEAEHPDVDVRLLDPGPLDAIDMVLERAADLAFIVTADNRRLAENYAASLDFTPCGELELRAVLPPEDEHISDPMDLRELDGRTLFVPRRTLTVPSLAEVVEGALYARGVVPRVKRTVATIPTCLPLVAAGLGVAILPEPETGGAPLPRITVRRIDPPLPTLQIAAVWRRDSDPSPAQAAMRELAVQGRAMASSSWDTPAADTSPESDQP